MSNRIGDTGGALGARAIHARIQQHGTVFATVPVRTAALVLGDQVHANFSQRASYTLAFVYVLVAEPAFKTCKSTQK